MKHVLDIVSLAMRRVKGKGIHAKNVLDAESRAQLVCLDEGYYIFCNLHNSPAYLEKRKKRCICYDTSDRIPFAIYFIVSG